MDDDRRRTFWHVLEHNQREGIFLPETQEQESEEEEEGGAMTALMRSTNKDTNCKLVRYVIESKREQKIETVLNFEELFEKVEREVSHSYKFGKRTSFSKKNTTEIFNFCNLKKLHFPSFSHASKPLFFPLPFKINAT